MRTNVNIMKKDIDKTKEEFLNMFLRLHCHDLYKYQVDIIKNYIKTYSKGAYGGDSETYDLPILLHARGNKNHSIFYDDLWYPEAEGYALLEEPDLEFKRAVKEAFRGFIPSNIFYIDTFSSDAYMYNSGIFDLYLKGVRANDISRFNHCRLTRGCDELRKDAQRSIRGLFRKNKKHETVELHRDSGGLLRLQDIPAGENGPYGVYNISRNIEAMYRKELQAKNSVRHIITRSKSI